MAKNPTRNPIQKASDKILQLHVSLIETDPLVWRRILVSESFSLEQLHSVLQLSMGWQMSHLYGFRVGSAHYTEPDEFGRIDAKSVKTTMASALKGEAAFIYDYDFGDDWTHTIKVEKVVARSDGFTYPICIGGENACPPEDCGGFFGFANLKKTISDPSNEEYQPTMMWLGGYYTPESFDANRINRDLLWNVDWRKEPNDQGLYLPFED